jgi:hypothetical protein
MSVETIAASRASGTVYPVRRYSPEGGFRSDGFLRLLLVLAVAAAGLGLAAYYVGKLFYLVILFPSLIGVALGALGIRMVKSGHLRDPWLGGLAGLLGGLLAMFVMHYAGYREFRTRMAEQVPPRVVALDDEQLIAALEAAKIESPYETVAVIHAMKSFPSYMALRAHQGVEISNHGGSPMNLGYYGSCIYWIVEVLIVALIALGMIRETASAPYCGPCANWKEQKTLAAITGDPTVAKRGVESGDPGLIAASGPDTTGVGRNMLSCAVCASCGGARSTIDLKLTEIIPQQKGAPKKKTRAHASWPGEALASIEGACRPAAVAAGALQTELK